MHWSFKTERDIVRESAEFVAEIRIFAQSYTVYIVYKYKIFTCFALGCSIMEHNSTDTLAGMMVASTASVGNVTNFNVTPTAFRYTFTQFMANLNPLALMVDRCVTPIWYLIGITGNILSAKIWMERRMRKNNSSAIYLATLSLTDLTFLLLHILIELKYAWDMRTLSFPVICEAYFMVYIVAQYLSPLLVLGFTVERWIAVCRPFQKEKYCTSKRASKVVAGFFILCILIGSMQAYLWMYDPDTKECMTRPETMEGGNLSFWSIWTWTTETLVFLVVPLIMLVFNILVIREVKKLSANGMSMLPGGQAAHGSSGAATTVMLLSVSFYVIITTLPATLVYALVQAYPEGDYNLTDSEILADPVWKRFFIYITSRKIVEEICLSHYACNFFLYLLTGKQFRQSLVQTLTCKKEEKWRTTSFYAEVSQRNSWGTTRV